MERTLEERHIAEHLEEPACLRISLETAPPTREEDEGKVRPFRLALEPVRKGP